MICRLDNKCHLGLINMSFIKTYVERAEIKLCKTVHKADTTLDPMVQVGDMLAPWELALAFLWTQGLPLLNSKSSARPHFSLLSCDQLENTVVLVFMLTYCTQICTQNTSSFSILNSH